MAVQFLCHDIRFALQKPNQVKRALLLTFRKEKKQAGDITYIFCSDRFLLSLNKKFLGHRTFTDIITFQYPAPRLSAEIFISIPRVKENAEKFNVAFRQELMRVMIHGALHLCGYKDKTASSKKKMRSKENFYLEQVAGR